MYTIVHAFLGYFFLLFTVRLLSRRPGAQMTPFEFVLVFLMGGVIILSTMGDDPSLTNAVGAVSTAALLHRVVTRASKRFPKLGAIADGTPLVLLKNGRWQADVMNAMRIQDTDVMAAARTKGLKTLSQIKYAILERNGAISIIKADEQSGG
jgi:uncharacterized membrane protein YcaP (DUF421 family)